MARARNIKPAFFSNEQLAECDPLARLLFAGLWCIADREGRLQDRPKRIKIELLPYDDCDVSELLAQLDKNGLIKRYIKDGDFIQITNFCKHQDPHYKEKSSEIPAPDGHSDSGATGGGVSEEVRQRIFDRDKRRCVECRSKEDLSLDHIVPRSKGGTHDEDNLRTLCRRCNSSKNNRLAKADIDQSSVNDRPTIGAATARLAPLIPDSLNLIPDSLTADKSMSADADPWLLGKEFLIKRGVSESTVGGFLGKLVKDHGKPAVIDALQAAIVNEPADVKGYIVGALRGTKAKNDIVANNLAVARGIQ